MFEDREGPTHRYMESSPGCWAVYGEVLAREYGDISYASLHRLTVDAYSVQHPGQPSPQSTQSVALHLMSLCLVLERGVEPARATAFLQAAAEPKGQFVWPGAPEARPDLGGLRVGLLVPASLHDSHLAGCSGQATRRVSPADCV